MEYRHILVAVELSDDTKVLIDRAAFFAEKLDAGISFVYIDGTHGEIYPEIFDIQGNESNLPINEDTINHLKEFETYAKHTIKHIFVGTGDLSDKLKMSSKQMALTYYSAGITMIFGISLFPIRNRSSTSLLSIFWSFLWSRGFNETPRNILSCQPLSVLLVGLIPSSTSSS